MSRQNELTYLDNNATTRVAPEVVESMLPYFTGKYGNPSSTHRFGGAVMRDIDDARRKVAALINCDPAEIIFTSCGTESDNAAIFGAVEALGADTTVITTKVEHPAVLQPCRELREHGHNVVEIGVASDGSLNFAEYEAALAAPGKKFVSMMWANNETGVVFPIARAAEMAREAGAVFHTDAVQAVGKLAEVDVSRVPVSMLSLSGHKLHAPKGVGALFIRRGVRVKPFLRGGHQERGMRAGTENTPYIVALGCAATLAQSELANGAMERIARLRDRLQEGLLKLPDASLNGDGDARARLPNTLNVGFSYIEGEAMLMLLSDAGICASSGSACTSGSLEPSHVIRAMGVPFTAAHGSLRFSFSRDNTDADVDRVLAVMPGIVAKLRALSPFVN
ncbi:MAG: cysteine desulfurase NifS [Kiritimatiellaeota bacterium]|nr:cysteine desulfurase NifS [Kiritimatiellota bacterium]